jgi:uncharacterized protein YqeY
MLIDDLKKRMFDAMKSKNTVEKEIIRTAIGEITATGQDADDARVLMVLRKLVKSNEETLKLAQGDARATLEQEIVVLRGFLPATLGAAQIVELLAPVAAQVRAAGNDGQAMGVAMKHLKTLDASAESADVKEAVKQLRSGA